uniref:DUF834 domain-containing protein n=1 Tax=Oryza glumipatula TaxID=40148 RepID=A0A0E0A779_9ORYZ
MGGGRQRGARRQLGAAARLLLGDGRAARSHALRVEAVGIRRRPEAGEDGGGLPPAPLPADLPRRPASARGEEEDGLWLVAAVQLWGMPSCCRPTTFDVNKVPTMQGPSAPAARRTEDDEGWRRHAARGEGRPCVGGVRRTA